MGCDNRNKYFLGRISKFQRFSHPNKICLLHLLNLLNLLNECSHPNDTLIAHLLKKTPYTRMRPVSQASFKSRTNSKHLYSALSSSLATMSQYIHHGLNAGTDLDDDDDNDDRDDDDDCGQGLVACSALV